MKPRRRWSSVASFQLVVGVAVLLVAAGPTRARADPAAESSPVSVASATTLPAGATTDRSPDPKLYLRLEGGHLFGPRLYRGGDRVRPGFFCEGLLAAVASSPTATVHARHARTAAVVGLGFSAGGLVSAGVGIAGMVAMGPSNADAAGLFGLAAATLEILFLGGEVLAFMASHDEESMSINAYNYDLISGTLATP